MGDLRGLIEVIEAGTLTKTMSLSTVDIWPDRDDYLQTAEWIWHSFHGSLDAAKALHEVLLPGWEWHLGPSNAKIYPYNGSPMKSWSGMADNPARAWLLAILRALEADGRA